MTFDKAQHGLSEKQTAGTNDLAGAFLTAFPSLPANEPNNFAELKAELTGSGLSTNTDYPLPLLMPQVVLGHRLWALAAKRDERFIALHDIRFIHDRAARLVWLELIVVADDLSRLGVTQQDFLGDAGLSTTYHAVDSGETWQNRPLLRFEQITPLSYPANHPADILPQLTNPLNNLLWSTVSIEPPYRRHYVYLAPNADRSLVLPQLLSIYATRYYFGSITRYRPHRYDAMIQGPYGSWIQEFFNGQPLQFAYQFL